MNPRRSNRRSDAGPPAALPPQPPERNRSSRRSNPASTWTMSAIIALLLWLTGVMIYQTHKPLPSGLSYESPVYRVENVAFWKDLTYPDGSKVGKHESGIMPRILQIIDASRQFLVVDMFLFNDYTHTGESFPKVSQMLADKLISHKMKVPDIDIVFITDEVNTNYGSAPNPLFERMEKAGISVIITDTRPLRDSTPAYSAVWRTFFQWFGQSGKGRVPNLMASGGPEITVRSYLKLLNVKANHRKLVVSEQSALISSGNVHDASAYHSNIALEVQGPVILDILRTEQAAADLSGAGPLLNRQPSLPATQEAGEDGAEIRYLTEGKIYKYALESLRGAAKGDTVWMGMFYLADDAVMDGLVKAAKRGASVKLLLDPNENAFGRGKIGIPNRPAALELNRRSGGKISIRWYNTGQEQYHSKLLFVDKENGPSIAIGGSANFTPRNLDDYNLENALWASFDNSQPIHEQLDSYFKKLWNNEGAEYSLPAASRQSATTWLKYALMRIQNTLGLTTY